ncbi:oxidoreductase : Putative dehydrogenase OS=Singulisphaera acidiphila (strain ATCC BAA-1392 / DSM 18658 / VKM B-2454 / MOB10) GN=Sinac_3719 PE=4 SV=1: GFO_IDH_MocA [Tuwongella immobilis]|uniref:Gfo/Idh/MocA-like oxidoreductase N-terminal domain-containing protein n=2 Tax=Tuwongella immobilis TaxID=692036 RepID=A0A6C2YST2_9BACT|nr:oxidoreductase : Putative dehydrogenase OS=Singulisphaera acidiphila (strain ATCC BAA-1392 / DSM 18658 / VKM B-2454 / MOB10) GN=Sinac_3719 PE=4 SV=1: GFO_IDH_MocA [Tuwongella immobilis]VTS05377.1 oxidoreductase : Putative dehydrogenase OS=Singulisphaera acidiphila (strain ATCC BAA-1392 / DSM 18658 / VKM B-2454 / MOB10) GN=Sinac_3719 PE=4 SV=1: GFO_IDH_MocA [Tuwongella immobilis]
MVKIGLVGVGFMGWIHYLAAQKLTGASLVAFASRDATKRAGDWRGIRGNFGPPGEQIDVAGLKTFATLEELLADPEIDLVDCCNPTGAHPETAIAALRAGKHVLVEKAIALDVADADRMLDAAKQAGKLLMVAHVLPYFPEFRFAVETVQSGKYGKLIAANFKRVISQPDWSAAHADAAATGGPSVDLHIHDTHFIGLLCGVPKAVFATGIPNGPIISHVNTTYIYGDHGPSVACSSGALAMKAREFVHGYEIYLERATLTFESGVQPLTVLHADGSRDVPALGDGDPVGAFTAELQAAVDGVRTGQMPPLLSGQLARDALSLCHLENQAVRTGQIVPFA